MIKAINSAVIFNKTLKIPLISGMSETFLSREKRTNSNVYSTSSYSNNLLSIYKKRMTKALIKHQENRILIILGVNTGK